jgi:quercetin dioxygenase-like cupin family protein
MPAHNIVANPIHLGRNAAASVEPEFRGAMDWYAAYTERHQSDGVEGRLVSMFTFDKSWDMWEMHPRGSEVVLCTAGRITLLQEYPDGTQNTVVLTPGEYAINAPGTWHTADIAGDATAVFITAGLGTQHRPRRS